MAQDHLQKLFIGATASTLDLIQTLTQLSLELAIEQKILSPLFNRKDFREAIKEFPVKIDEGLIHRKNLWKCPGKFSTVCPVAYEALDLIQFGFPFLLQWRFLSQIRGGGQRSALIAPR